MASTPSPAASTSDNITILVDSLHGRTIAFPTSKDSPLTTIYDTLHTRAPWIQNSRYILTTHSRHLIPHTSAPISTLVNPTDTFLPLRLTVPLCGGKGGFGSILRAQGGRMSSRKKQGEQNGSSRNLDGRRLRTVNEAKALAEYLAVKPDMEKKERDARRKKWEDIVASTDRKHEELVNGRANARLDGKWVEDKEEAETKTREAIERMLRESAGSEEEEEEKELAGGSKAAAPRAMFGWEDEDEEFMSDSEVEEEVSEEDVPLAVEGKGKAKAV
ncbi:hypothetical protein M011DRAFT_469112 [Sporormia fimetaria CBS 119925]|uniref:Uncharacterized protein n=1 Tax=Sporormia fimetaria CBS 119925 TaxID=1340428 RepID=A0A6A6V980_9PLEO|nr:hypothetical protein M011DRAFT_469112 [Sporormia fimetaria CBS 119925]